MESENTFTKDKPVIGISFTLKNQDFEQIKKILQFIAACHTDAKVAHAFMTRAAVEAKGFDTAVVDTLDELFLDQVIFFDEKPLREDLKNYLYDNKAIVYVIGDVKDGVHEEALMYLKAKIKLRFMELDCVPTYCEYTKEHLLSFGTYCLSPERGEIYNSENTEHPELVQPIELESWRKWVLKKWSAAESLLVPMKDGKLVEGIILTPNADSSPFPPDQKLFGTVVQEMSGADANSNIDTVKDEGDVKASDTQP